MMQRKSPYLLQAQLPWPATGTEAYPFSIPAIRSLGKRDALAFHSNVTFLVGENGTGKSTLLEGLALALGFGPEGGTRNVRIETAATTSSLHQYLRLARSFYQPRDYFFLRAESFYNVASYMDEVGYLGGFGDRSLHTRSHGESILALLTLKLRGEGLYLMDEPEAALSPARQLAALSAIHALVQQQSQFIIATHSPILLAYPGAQIYRFDEEGISEVAYEETEHFLLSRDFLNHYPKRLQQLLSTGED